MVLPKNAVDNLNGEKENKSILDELQTRRELLAQIIKRKMAFFGHACRNNKCNLVKTCILGMMPGKRRSSPGCNTSITSRSGQRHPWRKRKSDRR